MKVSSTRRTSNLSAQPVSIVLWSPSTVYAHILGVLAVSFLAKPHSVRLLVLRIEPAYSLRSLCC
jgi:hypothetical protein